MSGKTWRGSMAAHNTPVTTILCFKHTRPTPAPYLSHRYVCSATRQRFLARAAHQNHPGNFTLSSCLGGIQPNYGCFSNNMGLNFVGPLERGFFLTVNATVYMIHWWLRHAGRTTSYTQIFHLCAGQAPLTPSLYISLSSGGLRHRYFYPP